MSKKQYVLGLDIGTTSAKAVLFQKDGIVVSENENAYPVSHPRPSWVEQDPVEIEQAAIKAIAGAVEKSGVSETDILCVGISSAMHSLICLNDQHEPISPSITWQTVAVSSKRTDLKPRLAMISI